MNGPIEGKMQKSLFMSLHRSHKAERIISAKKCHFYVSKLVIVVVQMAAGDRRASFIEEHEHTQFNKNKTQSTTLKMNLEYFQIDFYNFVK